AIEGELDLEKHPEEDFHIFDLGKRQFFTLTTNVSNDGEPAYLPNLYISHDKAIDLSVSESNRSSYHCVPVKRGLLHCNLDNPLVNSTGPLRLVFKPSGFAFKNRYIDLIAWVNSTSKELRPRNNRIKFVLEVKRRAEISITGTAEPEQVFYSGDVVGESAIETLDEIGTEVVHNYLVDNRGPWRVDKLLVEIQWPYQVENNKKEGKWLLYLTDIPIVDGDGECDVNPEYVNPLVLYHKQLDVEDEASWGNERLTGVTPPSVSTTTKVTKVSKSSSKKVITSKKTYTKKESKHSSVSSSNFEEEDYDDYEGSGAYGRGGGTRTYNRVSRKVYTSPKNKIKTDKDSSIDYGTDEYENYDTFFSEKERERERDRFDGNRNVDGHSRYDVTHTRRVYTDSDTSGSDLVTD
ncbi:UNVERIFIED_CONTAM: hypothetical protein GTU68_044885, partial [Idotea baltica]|nr:hypothetical protein [Idotea baltica]